MNAGSGLGGAVAEVRAASLAEVCVVACAEAWRGDGRVLASPMGLVPTLGANLARLTFSPGLLLTDGEAYLLAPPGPAVHPGPGGAGHDAPTAPDEPVVEGWLPYRLVFTML